jgi:tripartite-type tricarboxylate transporter receptor subunit TctC
MLMNAIHRDVIAIVVSLSAVLAPLTLRADVYPSRPVRFINPAAAGSATDIVGRLIGEELGKRWGQSVIMDNRPGAGGVVAGQAAAQAAPDGHTFFFAAASALVIAPHLHPGTLHYDPERDFAPVGFVTEIPLVIGVRTTLAAQSLTDLLTLAAREPGGIHYAANTPGSFPHLAGELFARQAGVKLTFVPYKGAAAALHDLAGGRIAMIVEGVSGISGGLKSGQVRPLAVTSDRRLPDFPAIPAASETLAGFGAVGWFALFAPAKAPLPVLEKVHDDLRAVLSQPDLVTRLQSLGSYPRYMTRQQLAQYVRSERERWGNVARQLELKPQ